MAYFNHAFGKAFYAKTWNQTTTETSADLGGGGALGEFAFINANYGVLDLLGLQGEEGGFYLAQSSFQTNDTIGNNPGHGGYSESHKSKMIMKKYISKMWITDYVDENGAVTVMELASTKAAKIASAKGYAESCFGCGTDPIFRVDVKGTAALRLLNHNAYASLSGSLPLPNAAAEAHADFPADGVDMCCVSQGDATDGTNTVTHTGMYPGIVALNLRDQINGDPILSRFGSAEVHISRNAGANGMGAANGTFDLIPAASATEAAIYAGGSRGVTSSAGAGDTQIGTLTAIPATVDLATDASIWTNSVFRVVFTLKTSCELQTQFSSCSFDTRDFYLMGGLKAIISLQDEAGNPCVACQGYVKDIPATDANTPKGEDFKQRNISSDTVINSILLTENYRQSPYNQGLRDSSRFREQEGMSGIITELGRDATTSACNGAFVGYHLVHNVPRFNNPNGVFDNDQYHYTVYVKRASATLLESAWVNLAIDAKIQKRDASGTVATAQDLKDLGGEY